MSLNDQFTEKKADDQQRYEKCPISFIIRKKVKSPSRVRLFATPWTVAPPSVGFLQVRILERVAISFSGIHN